MRNLNLWLCRLIVAAAFFAPVNAIGKGMGGGVSAGNTAGVSSAPQAGATRPSIGFGNASSVREPFRGDERERQFDRRFDRPRRLFGGGWLYGYPYSYGYDDSSAQTTVESTPPEDSFDERQQAKDQQRLALPTSAFVKTYSWPSTTKTQPAVASSKPVRKAM